MDVADVSDIREPDFTLYRLHQSEAIFILDVVYITSFLVCNQSLGMWHTMPATHAG